MLYIITCTSARYGVTAQTAGSVKECIDNWMFTLIKGATLATRYSKAVRVNTQPDSVEELVDSLNKAVANCSACEEYDDRVFSFAIV